MANPQEGLNKIILGKRVLENWHKEFLKTKKDIEA